MMSYFHLPHSYTSACVCAGTCTITEVRENMAYVYK